MANASSGTSLSARNSESTVMRHFLIDDRGQDLVEYVLLGATIALASLTAMTAFPGIINALYIGWDNATQGLWYPADPTP
jgi:Flp pilus assembly pilin Flp